MKNLLFALVLIVFAAGCNTSPTAPTCCFEYVSPTALGIDSTPWDVNHDMEFLKGDSIRYTISLDAPADCINNARDLDSTIFKLGFYWIHSGNPLTATCLIDNGSPALYTFDLKAGESKTFHFDHGLRHPIYPTDQNYVWFNSCTDRGLRIYLSMESECFYFANRFSANYGPYLADTTLCGQGYPLSEAGIFPFGIYNAEVVIACPPIFPKSDKNLAF